MRQAYRVWNSLCDSKYVVNKDSCGSNSLNRRSLYDLSAAALLLLDILWLNKPPSLAS